MTEESKFPRLVSLAAHDLRTPLATVSGFAKTLIRTETLEEPTSRYVEIIDAAAGQMVELLDELGLAARIEDGRYQPNLRDADTLALAREAAATLGEDRVRVGGEGGAVRVDLEATQRAVTAQAQCALRHGGLELVEQLDHLPSGGVDDLDIARGRVLERLGSDQGFRKAADGRQRRPQIVCGEGDQLRELGRFGHFATVASR